MIRNECDCICAQYILDDFPNYFTVYLGQSPSIERPSVSFPSAVDSPLFEPSFAGAIALIESASELSLQTRRHWTSSLRRVGQALGKPLEVIPARYSAVRADLANLHHVPTGLTLKTLRNHKSNAKAALLWLSREKGIPEHGAPLLLAWER